MATIHYAFERGELFDLHVEAVKVFNYIYYRIAKIMYKRDGESAGMAITLVSILQTILLEFFVQPVLMLLFTKQQRSNHSKDIGILAGVIFIVVLIINYKKYDGKYNDYKKRWGNENKKAKFWRGWLLVLCFFILASIIIITNILNHKA